MQHSKSLKSQGPPSSLHMGRLSSSTAAEATLAKTAVARTMNFIFGDNGVDFKFFKLKGIDELLMT